MSVKVCMREIWAKFLAYAFCKNGRKLPKIRYALEKCKKWLKTTVSIGCGICVNICMEVYIYILPLHTYTYKYFVHMYVMK